MTRVGTGARSGEVPKQETTKRLALTDQAGSEACLVMINGPDLGRRFPLEGSVTIGRDRDSGIALDLEGVSRHHAEVTMNGLDRYVLDRGSTNGTFVNDARIDAATKLSNGDQLRFGPVTLKYLDGADVEPLFHEEIYRLTIFDGLTGVHNKRYFMDFLDRELARSSRYGRELSLAILDVDSFKEINDRLGHLAGDEVLRALCRRVETMVRKEHLFARFGGEEFALVLPEQGLEDARSYCEKVRSAIEALEVEYDGSVFSVTVSVGLAGAADVTGVDDFIRAADAELYRAKDSGKNRVVAVGDAS